MSSKSIYCSCTLCKSQVTTNNLKTHYNSAQCKSGGTYKNEKLKMCPHCSINFDDMNSNQVANHVRWCNTNPLRNTYNKTIDQLITSTAIEKKSKQIQQAHKDGKYKNAPAKSILSKINNGTLLHTEEAKIKIRESALKSPHQRKCKKSHKFTDIHNRTFIFDSSWEDALAIRLDTLNVLWDRPPPIDWIDYSGKHRKYFPDFYLPDYNLYIDPKNSYVVQQQQEKLEIISKMIKLQILQSLAECNEWCPP